jgi:hypothetical protein
MRIDLPMNFFRINSTWSNAEFLIIKICLVSLGFAAGMYFYEYLKEYMFVFAMIYVITAIVCGYLWVKKMKGR